MVKLCDSRSFKNVVINTAFTPTATGKETAKSVDRDIRDTSQVKDHAELNERFIFKMGPNGKYVVKWADVEELSPMSDVEPISGEPHSFVPKFPTVGQAS